MSSLVAFNANDAPTAAQLGAYKTAIDRAIPVAAVLITNTGNPIAVTSGTTELDMPKYALTGLTLTTGRYYMARYNVTYTKTVAGDGFDFKVRTAPAAGTQVALTGFNPTRSGTGAEDTFEFIFKGDATWTSLYLSVVRNAGSGTLSYYGAQAGTPLQYRAWGALYDLGDSTNWVDVP
jgi:hypothetical protein